MSSKLLLQNRDRFIGREQADSCGAAVGQAEGMKGLSNKGVKKEKEFMDTDNSVVIVAGRGGRRYRGDKWRWGKN